MNKDFSNQQAAASSVRKAKEFAGTAQQAFRLMVLANRDTAELDGCVRVRDEHTFVS